MLSAFGVRGDLKIEPLGPDTVFHPGRSVFTGDTERKIERVRRADRFRHVKFVGVDNREQAAELRGLYLQAPESSLDPPGDGTFYHFQLIGLRVVTTSGDDLGEITDIITTGANEVFVVREKRRELLIPAIEDVVREVDVEGGRMVIEAIPGLLPD